MTDIIGKLKGFIGGQVDYSAGFYRTAALASTQSESRKYYKKKKQATDEEFVTWYVDEVYKSAKFIKILENLGLKREELEHACWLGVVEAQEEMRNPKPPPVQQIGRNELCPCGSGKKYKRCCMGKN